MSDHKRIKLSAEHFEADIYNEADGGRRHGKNPGDNSRHADC